MKQELSKGAIAAIAVAVVAILGLVLFMAMRDPAPVHTPSMNPKDKMPAVPQAGPPPAWFVEKLHQNNAAAK